jgi:hypothetical protein
LPVVEWAGNGQPVPSAAVGYFGPDGGSGEAASFVVFVMVALMFLYFGLGNAIGGERIVLTPAGLAHRASRWRRVDVATLDEISTVVVSGNGADTRVDVQLGRRRLRILERVNYSEEQLRWCAQRLRRALDHARAAR